MTQKSVKIAKAIYVSEHMNRYPNIIRELFYALGDWDEFFTSTDLSSPEKLYKNIQQMVVFMLEIQSNHYELKNDLKRKRAEIRKMYDLPKGKKIPFFDILAIEKLLGKEI